MGCRLYHRNHVRRRCDLPVRWLLVIAAIFWGSVAFAQPTTPTGTCDQYSPGSGGQLCINAGGPGGWFALKGDVQSLINNNQCSPFSSLNCGYTSVLGLHFNGAYPNGTQLLLGLPPTNGQCLVDSGGYITGASCSAGGGTVTASPQYEIANYPTSGTVATVQGSSSVTTDSLGHLNVQGPSSCSPFGTGGGMCSNEGTAPTSTSGIDALYADSTQHQWMMCNNGGTCVPLGSGASVNPKTFGAVGNGIIRYDGAMSSGSSTLTSASGTFASSDVGKLICVDGVSSTTFTDQQRTGHVELCGTIATYNSATQVGLSFSNASGGSVSSQIYGYATDDCGGSDPIQTAINSLTNGGTVIFPAGLYGCGTTITLPYTVTVNLTGSGVRRITDVSTNHASPTTALLFLTKSLAGGGGITVLGPSGSQVYWLQDQIKNLALIAGTGDDYDGGCSTCDGIWLGNASNVWLDNDIFNGWGGYGVEIDGGAGTQPEVGVTLRGVLVQRSGLDGIGLGCQDNSSFLQDITITDYSASVNNWDSGLHICDPVYSFVSTGTSLWQGNNEGNNDPGYEMNITQSCYGCLIQDNYFEVDWGDTGCVQDGNSGQAILGANFDTDYFGGFYGLTLGTSSYPLTGGRVTNGDFPTSGEACFSTTIYASNYTVSGNRGPSGADCLTVSQSGTSGTATCTFTSTGTTRAETCYLDGYANTGSAQTVTYPLGFFTTPIIQSNSSGSAGSCGTYNASTTNSTLTLPANASMSAETCEIVVTGQ